GVSGIRSADRGRLAAPAASEKLRTQGSRDRLTDLFTIHARSTILLREWQTSSLTRCSTMRIVPLAISTGSATRHCTHEGYPSDHLLLKRLRPAVPGRVSRANGSWLLSG